MKKYLAIFLGIVFVFPLYSQEMGSQEHDDGIGKEAGEEIASEEKPASEPEKKKIDFARKYFEIGFDVGAGFDNGLVGLTDVFQKNIEIDLSKIAQSVPEDGSGLNVDFSVDVFLNIKNIPIGKGLWGFGFNTSVDGGVHLNIPKSLFELIAEGNTENHDASGVISASGGVFTEIGLTGWAKYKVKGKSLYIGVKPAVFIPAVYISPGSGISYHLKTEKDGREGLFIGTAGEISVYTAISFEDIISGNSASFDEIEPLSLIKGPSGFDLSLEGEYALSPFLDIGGSFSHIPFLAATLTNEMKMSMEQINIGFAGEDLISGEEPETPEPEINILYNNNASKDVRRPLRLDVYARYKPFKSEALVIRPNVGFSANINKGDEKWYINGGLELKLNLINLFVITLGSSYQEEFWKQRAGITFNLRALELDLQAVVRDKTFNDCFKGRGFEINVGMRFGF